jgi:DNA-binding transcriptional LysR family regulator
MGAALNRESFALRTDDQTTQVRLVQDGAGIGFFPCYVGAQLPGVSRLLADLPAPSLPVWLTVHREIRGNPLMRTVFDFLSEQVPLRLTAISQAGAGIVATGDSLAEAAGRGVPPRL